VVPALGLHLHTLNKDKYHLLEGLFSPQDCFQLRIDSHPETESRRSGSSSPEATLC